MKLKEKIALALQKELEPLGYHYFKSTGYFKKKIDKNTFVSISYDPVCSRGEKLRKFIFVQRVNTETLKKYCINLQTATSRGTVTLE